MSALDSVLGFFRRDDDDLEATQSAGRQRFGGAADPLGFLTSEFDPVASANSLAGPVYSDSMTGKSYVTEPDTDPRTDREILTDTAVAAKDAVVEYAQDPFLPTGQQVKDFGKAVVTETIDTFDRLASGDASLLEVLETATGVGLGAKAAQKAFPDPELDGSAFTTGMFLNVNSNNADTAALDRAKIAESNGVNREAIYKDTGWFRFADEWLYEISDKDTNIKLLQQYKKPLATLEEVEVPIGRGKDGLELIRLSALADINDLNLEFINGNITQDEFQAAAKQVNAKYAAEANAPVGTETVLKEVNPETPAKDKGILSEVLVNTDDLAAALPPGTMDQTAQIKGKRTGYYGVKYGGTPPKGLSKVNTFPGAIREKGENSGPEALVKDLGFFKIGNADKELLEQLNTGKISKDQFYADLTWGIMLHETQHLVQEALSFKSGRGGTQDAAQAASKEPANQAVRDAMKELAMQDGWKKTKALLKQYKQKGDQRNTGSAFVSILNLRRKVDVLGRDPNLDNDQILEEVKKARTSYIEKVQASFPSLSDADADALATEMLNDSDILDSTEVFDRIMVSRAGRLSNPAVTPAVDRDRDRLFPKSESKNPTNENERYAAYSHIAGEALARLTTARRNLSTEQLRERFPLEDLDVEENMMFRVGTNAYPEDYSIDTTPPPRPVETPEPPATKPSLDAEPDPQTIISVMDKNYFATENLNDADLRLKDPVGYVAGDILRFIEYFPNGATLKAIQGELIDGSPDPNSKDFLNKTQKKANEAFYTEERLKAALTYIEENGLAATLPNSADLIDTQIMPTWQRKSTDGTVLTREQLGFPPWPPVDPVDSQMDAGAMNSGPSDGGNTIVPLSASAGPKTLDVYYDSRYDMIDSRGASAEDLYTDPVEYYGNRPENIEGKLFKRTLAFNKPLEATSIRQAAVKLGIEKASPKRWEIEFEAKEQGFDGIILSDKKGNIKNIRELDNESTDLSRELKDTSSVTKPIFTNSDRFWIRNFREDYFHLMPQASEVNAKKYYKDLIEKGVSEQDADLAAADAFKSDMRTLAYYLAEQFPEHVDEIQVNPVAFINSVDSRMIEPTVPEIEPMFRPSQKKPEGDN